MPSLQRTIDPQYKAGCDQRLFCRFAFNISDSNLNVYFSQRLESEAFADLHHARRVRAGAGGKTEITISGNTRNVGRVCAAAKLMLVRALPRQWWAACESRAANPLRRVVAD